MRELFLVISILLYLSCDQAVIGNNSSYTNDAIKIEGSYERENSVNVYYGIGNVKLNQMYFGKDVKPVPSSFIKIDSDSMFNYLVIWDTCTIHGSRPYTVRENMLIQPVTSDTFFIEKEFDTLRLYQIMIVDSSTLDYKERGYRKKIHATNYLPIEGNLPLTEWPQYCNE